jgi:leucyl-tRNA synthetase
MEVPKDIAKSDLEDLALSDEAIKRFTSEGTVRKIIVVPNKLVNIVVN